MDEKRHLTGIRMMQWGVVAILLAGGVSVAQGKPEPPLEHGIIEIRATPEAETMLRIHNRDIAMLRATVGGFPPNVRAHNIAHRVNEILRDSTSPPSVISKAIPTGVAFYLGEHVTFALVYEDLDTPTDEKMEQVSEEAKRRLSIAVRESFEARSGTRLIEDMVFTFAATAVFLLFLLIVHKVRVRFQYFVDRRRRTVVETELRPAAVTRLLRGIFRVTILLAALGLELTVANLWLTFVLQRFPYTRPWGETFSSKMVSMLLQLGGAVARALPGLAIVAIIMGVCYALTRVLNKLFYSIKSGDITLQLIHPEVAAPTRRLAVAGIWIFGFVLAYPNLPGSQTEAFKGVSVLLGLLVTLGSSGVFGQALCGILLMYSRAFKAGDYVRINGTEGVVVEVGALSTKIRTIKNEIVNIPNSVVVTTQSKNFSMLQRTTGIIVHTSVTIGYTAPWRQVEAMLLTAEIGQQT